MFAFSILDDEAAVAYAHAFCLPAFDASSLNELVLDSTQPTSFTQQFQVAKTIFRNYAVYCLAKPIRTTETD